MQIQILNADERALSDIKNILSAYPKVKIKVKEQKSKRGPSKDSYPADEAPSIKAIRAYPFTQEERERMRREVLQECGLLDNV